MKCTSNFNLLSCTDPTSKVLKFKIVLIGDSGVGKTSILSCLLASPMYEFEPKHISTTYAYHRSHLIQVNGQTINTDIWDRGGGCKSDDNIFQFYRGALGAVLIYDVTMRDSFERVAQWVEAVRKSVDSEIVIMLVGNKVDMQHLRCVSMDEAQALAEKEGIFFIETSALELTNVSEAFQRLVMEIIPVFERRRIRAAHDSDTDDGGSDDDGITCIKNKKQRPKKQCCCGL